MSLNYIRAGGGKDIYVAFTERAVVRMLSVPRRHRPRRAIGVQRRPTLVPARKGRAQVRTDRPVFGGRPAGPVHGAIVVQRDVAAGENVRPTAGFSGRSVRRPSSLRSPPPIVRPFRLLYSHTTLAVYPFVC